LKKKSTMLINISSTERLLVVLFFLPKSTCDSHIQLSIYPFISLFCIKPGKLSLVAQWKLWWANRPIPLVPSFCIKCLPVSNFIFTYFMPWLIQCAHLKYSFYLWDLHPGSAELPHFLWPYPDQFKFSSEFI
jgi:hypothetical protein